MMDAQRVPHLATMYTILDQCSPKFAQTFLFLNHLSAQNACLKIVLAINRAQAYPVGITNEIAINFVFLYFL